MFTGYKMCKTCGIAKKMDNFWSKGHGRPDSSCKDCRKAQRAAPVAVVDKPAPGEIVRRSIVRSRRACEILGVKCRPGIRAGEKLVSMGLTMLGQDTTGSYLFDEEECKQLAAILECPKPAKIERLSDEIGILALAAKLDAIEKKLDALLAVWA
jgi:hypothetical protein